MNSVVLDAGALIAMERGNHALQALLERLSDRGTTIVVPAAVVAEVWRDGTRQVRVARLLAATQTEIVPLDYRRARAVGVLLGLAGTDDVVDASVVIAARERGHDVPVVSSDPGDLGILDSKLVVVAI